MPRRYLFSDESGNLDFSNRMGATRYFAVGTLLIGEDELTALRSRLAALRDRLAWENQGLDSYFHATNDKYSVRDAMFSALVDTDFTVDVTLLDKPKAPPPARVDDATFFRSAWHHHLEDLAPLRLAADDQLMVVAAELGTKKGRKAFRSAINEVLTECVPYRVKRTLAFWPCSSDFALQAVDYCLWATFRKFESGDDRYFKLVEDKVATAHDVWENATVTYY